MTTKDKLIEQSAKLIGEIVDNYEADAINLPAQFYNDLKYLLKQLKKIESELAKEKPEIKKSEEREGYSEWRRKLVVSIKHYPLIKNKWKSGRFKKMYKDGLSVNEAFRCWYCAH